MALGCDVPEVGRHVHFRDAFQVADRAVDHQAAALGRLHDVVEEVVADDRAALLLAEQVDHQHVARLQHVDRDLIVQPRPVPAPALFAVITPSTSGRTGMNCTVNARPTSFLPGMQHLEAVFVLVAKTLARQHGRTLPPPTCPARARSGHRAPSAVRRGSARTGSARCSSINCSLLQVKTWARATTGAIRAATHAHAATAGIDPNLQLALIVSFMDSLFKTISHRATPPRASESPPPPGATLRSQHRPRRPGAVRWSGRR